MHLNRLIKKYDLDVIYISGPGHGAPATLSNCYLEGVYSEVYPDKSRGRGRDCRSSSSNSRFPEGSAAIARRRRRDRSTRAANWDTASPMGLARRSTIPT